MTVYAGEDTEKKTDPLLVGANLYSDQESIDVPQDEAISLLGVYPKITSSHHRDTCPSTFIGVPLISARDWKQPTQPSMD